MIPNLKVEVLDPVLCKGLPSAAGLEALDALAEGIVNKHKEAGMVSSGTEQLLTFIEIYGKFKKF